MPRTNKNIKLNRRQEIMDIIGDIQDEIGLEEFASIMTDVQNNNWDHYVCKFGTTEYISKFYEKSTKYFDTLTDKIGRLKKRYTTLRQV